MKVGDFVSVRYRVRRVLPGPGPNKWEKPLLGFIFEAPEDGLPLHHARWRMWCLKTGSVHILAPHLDLIEVINESR